MTAFFTSLSPPAAVAGLVALLPLVLLVVLLRRPGRPAENAVAGMAAALAVVLVALATALARPGLAAAAAIVAAVAAVAACALAWSLVGRKVVRGADRGPAASDAPAADRTRRRFEQALSSANVTAFTQDRGLRYTWLQNPRPGLTPADLASGGPEASDALALKREALASGRATSGDVAVREGDGSVRHFDLTVRPTLAADGSVDGLLGTAVDVTDRRLFDMRLAATAAQAASAYRRFVLALEDSPITVFEQDTDLRYTFMHNPPAGTGIETFLGRSDPEIFDEVELRKFAPLKRRAIETGEGVAFEVDLALGGDQRFFAVRLEPRAGANGSVEGLLGTAVDLTERRRHEQNMKLVMRELTHRSKNLLAVVQAMARKTASLAPDPDSFVRDFSARLRAMAAAQDLLVSESWTGVGLRDLLLATLSQSLDPDAPEITVEGPDLKLAPDATQMLGLALNELTMNAVRHGALSVEGGRLAVCWTRDLSGVRLSWHEQGGPPVIPPRRIGFGRVMLERLVSASLGGAVSMAFRPEGLQCEITFPGERLAA